MKTRLLLLGVAGIATILVASPANAAGTVVMGAQAPVSSGPCFDATAAFSTTMDGGLVGCWYGDTFVLTGEHPSGTITASGTEHFVGCLDMDGDGTCGGADPTGTFSTTYTFTAKYDVSGAEIHGRCNHPIVSGTGGFEGVTGVVEFTDDVSTGISYYKGVIIQL